MTQTSTLEDRMIVSDFGSIKQQLRLTKEAVDCTPAERAYLVARLDKAVVAAEAELAEATKYRPVYAAAGRLTRTEQDATTGLSIARRIRRLWDIETGAVA